MKKFSKLQKTLVLSGMAVLAFGTIAAGSTYALFTNKTETNVTVTTGKVAISKTVTLEGGKTLNGDEEVDATVQEDGTVKFGASGTAKVDADGNVVLSGIVSGDKVTVKVHVTNSSTVDIKYRTVVSPSADDTAFGDIIDLEGQYNGDAMPANREGELFTRYTKAEAGVTDLGDFTLTIGIDKDTDVTNGTETNGTIKIVVDAIQANAKTEDKSEYFPVTTPAQLVESIEEAAEGSTVEITEPITLSDTVTVEKDLNVLLSDDVTAEEGKTAFVATEGSVLTIGATETITSHAEGKALFAPTVTTPTITVSGDKVAGVKAEGKGSKVIFENGNINSTYGGFAAIDGGEIVVKDGTFETVEYGALAHGAGKLTIEGGNFTTTDNFVVGTNGTTGWGENVITITGGTFNGKIKSAGYIACGVYVANNDVVDISGKNTTFNIEDGCGILARSGNTTVSDEVNFNFTQKATPVTEGGVGDKTTKIPANAKFVKDLSKDAYPGGLPTIDAKGVIEVTEKDGKGYVVTTEKEINDVLDDKTIATKYIYVKNDLELTRRLDIQTKNTTIFGDGKTIKVTNDTESNGEYPYRRVFNLDQEDDPELNCGYFAVVGINGTLNSTYDDGRGISTYMLKGFKIVVDDSSFAAKYPFTLGKNGDGITVVARNSSFTGYSAFQTWSDNVTGTFENCILTSKNVYPKSQSNGYGTIVVETQYATDDKGNVTNPGNGITANLSFAHCEIHADNTPSYNEQVFLLAEPSAKGSTTFRGCKFYQNYGEEGKDESGEPYSVAAEDKVTFYAPYTCTIE